MPSKHERRLREILASLPEAQVTALMEYAEFLATRYTPTELVTEPLTIPRPEKESVIKAIQRLGATYPMVDRGALFNEASTLMTQHIIHGKDAVEVIDQLEMLFRQHFEKLTGK